MKKPLRQIVSECIFMLAGIASIQAQNTFAPPNPGADTSGNRKPAG